MHMAASVLDVDISMTKTKEIEIDMFNFVSI